VGKLTELSKILIKIDPKLTNGFSSFFPDNFNLKILKKIHLAQFGLSLKKKKNQNEKTHYKLKVY
jgi:hypothetical protein